MALTLIITDAGRRALVNAASDGTNAVRIAACGISSTAVVPAAGAVALPGEINRITTLAGKAVAADVMHLVVRDESAATYTLRSFALYLQDGTLFGIYGQAEPILEKSAQALMLLSVDVTLVDVAATSLTFGDTNFLNPPATTETAGVVELATEAEELDATDRRRAVTPAALARTIRRGVGNRPIDYDGLSGMTLITGDAAGWDIGYKVQGFGGKYLGGFGALGQGAALNYYWIGPTYNADNTLRVHANRVTWGDNLIWHAANDGAGSGLDADLLDGQHGSYYADVLARLGFTPIQQGGGPGQSTNKVRIGWDSGFRLKASVDGGDLGNFVFDSHVANVWRSNNDGAGSGLDADLLDGLQASDFIRRASGTRPIDYDSAGGALTMRGDAAGWELSTRFYGVSNGYLGGFGALGNGDALSYFYMGTGYASPNALRVYPSRVSWGDNVIWHAGNDGAGSGLDADLLDGQHGAYYADVLARLGFVPIQQGGGVGQATNKVRMGWDGARLRVTVDNSDLGAVVFDSNVPDVWRASNDGAGSGLDADLLDGLHASDFIRRASGTRPIDYDSAGGALTMRGDGAGWELSTRYIGSAGTFLGGFGALGGADTIAYLYMGPGYAAPNALRVYPSRVSWGDNVIWHAANDGAGSGLDADLLDGQHGSYYADVLARLGFVPVQQGGGVGQAANRLRMGWDGARVRVTVDNSDLGAVVFDSNVADAWRPSNDGAGSGLDADLLDGLQASDFIRRASGGRPIDYDSAGGALSMRGDGAGWELSTRFIGSAGTYLGGFGALGLGDELSYFYMGESYASPTALRVSRTRVSWGDNVIWHAGNDGAGSGLDADLLDGQHGAWYADVVARLGYTPLAAISYTASDVLAKALTVDGAGSGLDADLLDGRHAEEFVLASAFGGSPLSENGYQVLPGGLILQWCTGFQNSSGGGEPTQTITFPIAFPNRCLNAQVTTQISSAAVSVDTFYQMVGVPSASGCVVQRQVTAQGADSRPTTPMIFAIGF